MIKTTEVKGCFINCPLLKSDPRESACGHPYFQGRGYDAMIVERGENIPDKCPLRAENYVHTIKIEL